MTVTLSLQGAAAVRHLLIVQTLNQVQGDGELEIIKNAIRKGALSNTVIGTSSDKNVNTTAMVKQVNDNLGGIN